MAKKLRKWLQKRLNKTKIFYPSDYSSYYSSSQGGVTVDGDVLYYDDGVASDGVSYFDDHVQSDYVLYYKV